MRYRLTSLLLVLFSLSAVAFAAEPPKDPLLRIDAGAHSAKIKRISVDAAGRTVLSCSMDKTARLYDIESGALLKVFHPPAGFGDEGKLYACSLSPDGTLAAVGGWDTEDSIYIFNTSTGEMVSRISGLKNVMHHITFSRDGRRLAASLGGKRGVRLFRVSDGKELGRDSDYGDRSHSIDFAPDGRLISTSYDGYLRLYDRSMTLLKKVKGVGGEIVASARFTTDGSRIAVGYDDSPQVDIYSGVSLKHLFSADVKGIAKTDNLGSVEWSADGKTLYAGGSYGKWLKKRWRYPVVSWNDGGRGPREMHLVGAMNTMMEIVAMPGGGLLYGGADPVLGILKPDGSHRLLAEMPVADYRGDLSRFKISSDASVVRFGYRSSGKEPALFDVNQRQLLPDTTKTTTLYEPRTKAESFTVTDWEDKYQPKFNDTDLKLKKYERSRSLAISPDEQRFVLGTGWFLRCYDATGKEVWKKEVPEVCWSVNIALNGQVVVVGYGDGTIRWHRLSDGAELLALFPHADKKRWVLWTPGGYYAASPGGEELIGWHVNNGKDQAADFFPASRFRESRYRPDIVAKVLETFDEKRAIAAANIEGNRSQTADLTTLLPPVVTITSHQNGSLVNREQLDLQVSVRSPSGAKVTGLKILVDGRPVSRSTRGISLKNKQASGSRALSVTIPPRDCEVSVIAETADTSSVPATVRLAWAGTKPQKEEFVAKPKLYVLAIGVSDYQDKELTLGYAAKDARDFAAALKQQKGGLYRDVVTKALTDTEATSDNILDGLDWLETQTTARDVAMLFLAGHGVNDKNGVYNFLPHDVNLDRLRRTGLPFHDIKTTLAALSGKAILFVDTCHSGNVMGGRRAAPTDINGLVNELASAENGAVVFASSTGRQYSLEDPKWGNGAFTKALVEGLSGKADYTGKGKISINMLDLYLSERVKELTGGKQTPTTTKPSTISDFPVAVKR